ncbi:MAG: heme-binding domain-containing protein [Chlorobi bacterium]|nr:heme-binding domain-containing protein [Chlorobiota bacterium]
MNKRILTFTIIAGLFISLTAFVSKNTQRPLEKPKTVFTIPEDVNTIFQNKCFDCHNVNADGEKSKKKLLIDKLPTLSKAKLIGKLDAISEVADEKEMPPEKFLAKYPEYTLTDDEAKRLSEWATAASDKMMK